MAPRSLAVLLALIALCLGFGAADATASGDAIGKGDINCDGEIAVSDATRLLGYLGGVDNSVGSGCPFVITQVVDGAAWGDLDCAGGVGGSDVLRLLRHTAGYDDPPQACPQIGDPAEMGPGHVVCDMLFAASYRYTSEVYYRILAPGSPIPAGGIPQPHDFRSTFTAEVEDGVDRHAVVDNVSWPNTGHFEIFIVGDHAWRKSTTWQDLGTTSIYDPLPYEPATYCESLAPDIDTSLMPGVPDPVGGIPATRIDVETFPNDWTLRNPDYGGGSDVTKYVPEFDGSIWVADGARYIAKMDLHGVGFYEDGTVLDLNITFDVRDLYDETIEIEPPVY